QLVLTDQRPDRLGRVAEGQVDDLGAVVHDPLDAADHVRALAGALGAQHLGHHQLGVGGDAGDALAVVLDGGGEAAPVGAVALVVLGAPLTLGGVAAGTHATDRFDDLACEVLVLQVDARVDDPDPHAGAGRAGPGLFGADAGQAPLVAERRIVGRPL